MSLAKKDQNDDNEEYRFLNGRDRTKPQLTPRGALEPSKDVDLLWKRVDPATAAAAATSIASSASMSCCIPRRKL